MELLIRVSKKIEQGEFAGMYRAINKMFIFKTENKNITEKLKDEIVSVIESRNLMVRKESISKYDILEDYEIYESGGFSYSTRNGGGIAREYEFIELV